ncbi:MAG: DEAD/DEAH box helicase family protein [Anaerolineae bacterium]|nr:DEAD/DEAH box helicase family protein [Anaerolineae bacterium]
MPRKARNPAQASFVENFGTTAPAVPAVRQAVSEWEAGGFKGVSDTTRRLLNHWFHTDHKLANGRPFKYHRAQEEAIKTLIYVYEVAGTRTLTDLYQTFIPRDLAKTIRLPDEDPFARYAIKMATGSGKTKVMALAIAWQYFNAVREGRTDFARSFLIIAPNVIVFERLAVDFAGGRIFRTDPIIPKEFGIDWDMQTYMRGESERASSLGAVYLTNIQQLYDRQTGDDGEVDVMTALLGSKPPASLASGDRFPERLLERADAPLMVLNDEAHHTHDDELKWNEVIRDLNSAHPCGLALQADFSATPRYTSGSLFAWTITDYPLKNAIIDRIVKRPVKGVTDIGEVQSNVPYIKYEPFLVAAVERWREYRDALAEMGKRPLLFVMMGDTEEADSVGGYLQRKWPVEFGGDQTLIIHTNRKGDISKADEDKARKAAREVDQETSPVNAIVSVLMLREGWDVQNVTVIVGLRAYTAKANILPEQTIGRGLRLMFRDPPTAFVERVDVLGNPGFIRFVEELEKTEDVQFGTWEVGKDKLVITTIAPDPEKAEADIAIPSLSPILTRRTSLGDLIDSIDVMKIPSPVLPLRDDGDASNHFTYEGKDILTLESLFQRQYVIPEPQTSQEIIAYYAELIAGDIKLPGQFAVLAPKVRDFLKYKAFGREIDLDTVEARRAINRSLTRHVTQTEFLKLLRAHIIEEQTPVLETDDRKLSEVKPFAWSQDTINSPKCIFSKVPVDNKFEAEFARFLDKAHDVARFTKLPLNIGFSLPYTDRIGNLRQYYPDFVVVDTQGGHWLVETKGMEDIEVASKDRAAVYWADNATTLTGVPWDYVKVRQHDFSHMQPTTFEDCAVMGAIQAEW